MTGRGLLREEKQARLDNHYGYCKLPPNHDGPCASGRVCSFCWLRSLLGLRHRRTS